MKYLTIFAVLMITTTNTLKDALVFPPIVSKKEAAITKQIIKNKPNINKKLANKLSKYIHKYATIFKADSNRAVAIAMQESGFANVINKNSNKTRDLGIFQINTKTAKEYGFDTKRLINDQEYSVKAYFTVMRDKVKMCNSRRQDSWICYHSKNRILGSKYKKLVNRFYVVN